MVTETKKPDILLTSPQIAARLNMNPWTVREMLRSGELRGFKIRSTRWRVKESDLEAFIEKSQHNR